MVSCAWRFSLRAAPAANLLLPLSNSCDMVFLLFLALCTHSGDLSKVQWPASLQEFILYECRKVEGKFLPRLTPFAPPTNTNEHPPPCGPSRKPPYSSSSLLPTFCPVCSFACRPAGDISKVQWPEGLQYLNLAHGPEASGASLGAVPWFRYAG